MSKAELIDRDPSRLSPALTSIMPGAAPAERAQTLRPGRARCEWPCRHSCPPPRVARTRTCIPAHLKVALTWVPTGPCWCRSPTPSLHPERKIPGSPAAASAYKRSWRWPPYPSLVVRGKEERVVERSLLGPSWCPAKSCTCPCSRSGRNSSEEEGRNPESARRGAWCPPLWREWTAGL